MLVVSLPILLAVVGLAVDFGRIYTERRAAQIAADAGAMSAVAELYRGLGTSAAQQSGWDASKMNGFDTADAAVNVSINIPPTSGPNQTNDFAEAIVTRNVKTTFLRIFSQDSAMVRARAVAGLEKFADFCVLALNPTARGGLKVAGGATLNAACGVMVNSDDPDALQSNSGVGCVDAASISLTGGSSGECVTPTPLTGTPRALDPLAYLSPPAAPQTAPIAEDLVVDTSGKLDGDYLSSDLLLTNSTSLSTGSTYFADYGTIAAGTTEGFGTTGTGGIIITGGEVTLKPGYYKGNPSIKIMGGNVTFQPGIYILDSGLSISGNPTVTAEGVLFYNTKIANNGWNGFSISGGVVASFSGLGYGPYEGMLFWQDKLTPANVGSKIVGNSTAKYEGAFYLPSTELDFAGTSQAAAWTMMVADRIVISGDANVTGGYSPNTNPDVPTRKVALLE